MQFRCGSGLHGFQGWKATWPEPPYPQKWLLELQGDLYCFLEHLYSALKFILQHCCKAQHDSACSCTIAGRCKASAALVTIPCIKTHAPKIVLTRMLGWLSICWSKRLSAILLAAQLVLHYSHLHVGLAGMALERTRGIADCCHVNLHPYFMRAWESVSSLAKRAAALSHATFKLLQAFICPSEQLLCVWRQILHQSAIDESSAQLLHAANSLLHDTCLASPSGTVIFRRHPRSCCWFLDQ